MTMTLIEHIKLTGSESSIVLDNIPQIYTDLYIKTSLRTDYGGADIADSAVATINAVTTNQSALILYGAGSGGGSSLTLTRIRIGEADGASATSSTFANSACYIPNYTGSTAKSFSMDGVIENNGSIGYQAIFAQLWDSTDAITDITLTPRVGSNFVQYSSVTLFGILAGSDGTTTVS